MMSGIDLILRKSGLFVFGDLHIPADLAQMMRHTQTETQRVGGNNSRIPGGTGGISENIEVLLVMGNMPGGFEHAEEFFLRRHFAETDHSTGIKPGTDQHAEFLFFEKLRGRPFGFGIFVLCLVTVLPVGDHDIARKFFVKLAQLVLGKTADDISVPAGIALFQQHIVPHDDPGAALLE